MWFDLSPLIKYTLHEGTFSEYLQQCLVWRDTGRLFVEGKNEQCWTELRRQGGRHRRMGKVIRLSLGSPWQSRESCLGTVIGGWVSGIGAG